MTAEARHEFAAVSLAEQHSAGNVRMAARAALTREHDAARAERDDEWIVALRDLHAEAREQMTAGGDPVEVAEWGGRAFALEDLAEAMGVTL